MTLLELMFASGVLAMGLALLFGSLVSINVLGNISEDRTSAAVQVASVLEHLRTQSYDDLLNYQLPPEPSAPGVKRAIVVECFDENGGSVPLPLRQTQDGVTETPNLPSPLEVRVTMAWASENGRAWSVQTS